MIARQAAYAKRLVCRLWRALYTRLLQLHADEFHRGFGAVLDVVGGLRFDPDSEVFGGRVCEGSGVEERLAARVGVEDVFAGDDVDDGGHCVFVERFHFARLDGNGKNPHAVVFE